LRGRDAVPTLPGILIPLCGLINPTLQRILLLPSNFCLEAPLVTLGWAILLRQTTGRGFSRFEVASLAALAVGTWLLYLADRLWDAGRVSTPTSLRVEFAKRNRLFLNTLLGTLLMVSLFAILPELTAQFLGKAAILGTFAVVYYALFRTPFSKAAVSRFAQLPLKEIMIATCLTGGIFLGSGTPMKSVEGALSALAFTGLFLGNCLIISRAEAKIDQCQDPAAYFARERSSPVLPELILVLPLLSGTALELFFQPLIGITFLLATGLLACTAHHRLIPPAHTQAAADASLMVCWLFVAAQWISERWQPVGF
jgi:hypothetical protein